MWNRRKCINNQLLQESNQNKVGLANKPFINLLMVEDPIKSKKTKFQKNEV